MKSTKAGGAILNMHLVQETDFLLARQRAKQIAQELGFEVQDQTRIATAVSEVARNAFEYGKEGRVEFFLDAFRTPPRPGRGDGPQFRIVVSDKGPGIPDLEQIWSGVYRSSTGMGIGLLGSRRLMDGVDIDTGSTGTRVTLVKYLPRNAPPPPSMAEIGARLANAQSGVRSTALEQNHELMTLLNDLRTREAELQALNAELEETNRGVLVLYAELEDKAQAVQAASELKTRFLSGVTHELRTPLNSIVSLARLMLSHTDGPLNAEQEKQVHFMLRSAQTLTDLVNDLLDLARIEAGKAVTNLTNFTVTELFTGLRGMFRPLATNPNVKLIFDIPDRPLMLRSDEGKLAQILRNFISNALKFTEAGTIRVSAEPVGGSMIRFSVEDTGVGIAPEHHELVMQEWGQVQSLQAGASARKGSGLGLPLSRSLADLLGGATDFTSSPGVGSRFNVTLPALLLEKEEAPASLPEHCAQILVVDDDEVARYLLRRTLATMTTAEIEEATSGKEALECIAARLPCLVFLDLVMPEMDGHELARRLRAQEATAALPIVLFTAQSMTPAQEEELQTLEVTVISKRPGSPTDPEQQRVEIERTLLQVGLSNRHQGQDL